MCNQRRLMDDLIGSNLQYFKSQQGEGHSLIVDIYLAYQGQRICNLRLIHRSIGISKSTNYLVIIDSSHSIMIELHNKLLTILGNHEASELRDLLL